MLQQHPWPLPATQPCSHTHVCERYCPIPSQNFVVRNGQTFSRHGSDAHADVLVITVLDENSTSSRECVPHQRPPPATDITCTEVRVPRGLHATARVVPTCCCSVALRSSMRITRTNNRHSTTVSSHRFACASFFLLCVMYDARAAHKYNIIAKADLPCPAVRCF